MFPDEEVLHDGLPVVLQNELELVDVVVLVRGYEIRHCQDLGVIFVGLRLLKNMVWNQGILIVVLYGMNKRVL